VQREPLESIYFWWGTPSILSEQQLSKIIWTVETKFGYHKNIEITLESTPQNITPWNIKAWEKLWINRISTGVQSLNLKTLKEIGRVTPKMIFEWLWNLEKSKIQNISVDFIIGLPYTKPWDVQKDISRILKAYPYITHVSVYMLEDYYYPDHWASNSFSHDLYQQEYDQVQAFLLTKGYQRYEISNFARPWYACQHNQAYWNHTSMIAFWLDAHGYIDGKRYAYPNTFTKYYTGKLAYEEVLTPEEVRLEKYMFWLRTQGISLTLEPFLDAKKIEYFIEHWHLYKTKTHLVLHEASTSILDHILQEIIATWKK
jgi:coproporphyrinogen III oxidase-like Fe-S oxidoreductase